MIGFPLTAFNLILVNRRFFLLDLVKNADWLNSLFPLTSPLLAQLFLFLPLLKYLVCFLIHLWVSILIFLRFADLPTITLALWHTRGQFPSVSSANLVASAIMSSRPDYCNASLTGLSSHNLHRLQCVQNRAARIVLGVGRRTFIDSLLWQLHRLPIAKRITKLLICLITPYLWLLSLFSGASAV